MTNNDILRRIRYTFDFNDSKMIAIFGLADHQVTREQVSDWLKKDDDPAFRKCSDAQLAVFLNGLINDRRGKKEGEQPEPEQRLTNNIIFKKLKIALDLKAEDILHSGNYGKPGLCSHGSAYDPVCGRRRLIRVCLCAYQSVPESAIYLQPSDLMRFSIS